MSFVNTKIKAAAVEQINQSLTNTQVTLQRYRRTHVHKKQLHMHHRKNTFAFGWGLSPGKGKQTQTGGLTLGEIHLEVEGGLNITRFADSRKGGGNAMGKGGGSREREWGILTVTYRQRVKQSRAL